MAYLSAGMKRRLLSSVLLLMGVGCVQKKENTTARARPVEIEQAVRSQLKALGGYAEIICPDNAVGHAKGSRNICFAGNTSAEEFIQSFTDKMTPVLKENVYWRRDYGLWHTEMKFKQTDHSLVMTVMTKADADLLESNPDMKNYDLFIACALFDQ